MIRTTVVGTYPRIGDAREEQLLRRTIARFDRGEATDADVRAAERETIRAVLQEQAAAGIDVVTDGQVGWSDSQSHVAGSFDGVEVGGLVRYFDTNTYYRQPVVTGPVRWKEHVLLDAWQFAQDASRAPVKAVLPGPVTLASLALDRHYGKKRPLAIAFAEALAEEVAGLRSAGARHIQVDEPVLTRHPEALSLVADTLELLAVRKGPAELTLATYFGNVGPCYRGLLELPADVLGLDLVQGAKTWSQIAKRGSEKPLALGVIDARNTMLEDSQAVAGRVRALDGAVDLDACYLQPSNGLEFLPRESARRKLRVLAEAAQALRGSP